MSIIFLGVIHDLDRLLSGILRLSKLVVDFSKSLRIFGFLITQELIGSLVKLQEHIGLVEVSVDALVFHTDALGVVFLKARWPFASFVFRIVNDVRSRFLKWHSRILLLRIITVKLELCFALNLNRLAWCLLEQLALIARERRWITTASEIHQIFGIFRSRALQRSTFSESLRLNPLVQIVLNDLSSHDVRRVVYGPLEHVEHVAISLALTLAQSSHKVEFQNQLVLVVAFILKAIDNFLEIWVAQFEESLFVRK